MKLIVGLGNPGPEYAKTRHNAGFLAVDRLVQRHGLDLNGVAKGKFHAQTIECRIAGERCLLLKPLTFMNRSGLTVGEAVAFFKASPKDDLLVLVDDIALPVGKIRIRHDGSAGGHNGLADIQRALGTSEYGRLRIGIDPKGPAPQKDYVLGRFSPDQWARLDPCLSTIADAIEFWIKDGVVAAMNKFNASGA